MIGMYYVCIIIVYIKVEKRVFCCGTTLRRRNSGDDARLSGHVDAFGLVGRTGPFLALLEGLVVLPVHGIRGQGVALQVGLHKQKIDIRVSHIGTYN